MLFGKFACSACDDRHMILQGIEHRHIGPLIFFKGFTRKFIDGDTKSSDELLNDIEAVREMFFMKGSKQSCTHHPVRPVSNTTNLSCLIQAVDEVGQGKRLVVIDGFVFITLFFGMLWRWCEEMQWSLTNRRNLSLCHFVTNLLRACVCVARVGYPSVGSLVGVSNAVIAHRLRSCVLYIGKAGVGDAIDSLNLGVTYFQVRMHPPQYLLHHAL